MIVSLKQDLLKQIKLELKIECDKEAVILFDGLNAAKIYNKENLGLYCSTQTSKESQECLRKAHVGAKQLNNAIKQMHEAKVIYLGEDYHKLDSSIQLEYLEYEESFSNYQIVVQRMQEVLLYHKNEGNEKEISRACDGISKLESAIKRMGLELFQTLDSQYFAANNKDKDMINQIVTFERIDFKSIAQKILNTIDYMRSGLNGRGKGSGNKLAKQYIAGIEYLFKLYKDTFPKRKVSFSKGTHFYKYVKIWFNSTLGIEDSSEAELDIRRHMNKAKASIIDC